MKKVVIPLICFLALAILLSTNSILPIDLWVYDNISYLISNPLTVVMKIITFFGETKTIIGFSILLIIYFSCKNQQELKPFLIVLLLSTICIVFLKAIFQRERPDILRLIPIDGYSFPSGHSIISVSFYGYLTTYFMKQIPYRNILLGLCLFMIIGIGFSRIYLGVHYFSDVLAGYSLGLFALNTGKRLRKEGAV